MTEALLDIKHWGNNLGVRLPAAVAREANFHADQWVRVSAEAGRVIILSVDDAPLTLEPRLSRFDPVCPSGKAMSREPLGAERW